MTVDKTMLANICRTYGTFLHLPAGIDGAQLLWAISGNETSFGQRNVPRHEQAYCYGGRYCDKSLSAKYGCLAHCSLGPWQLMATNAIGFSPYELLTDPDIAAHATINFLNRVILDGQGAKTLEEIADAYNSGNFRDANVPQKYIAELLENYKKPIGE